MTGVSTFPTMRGFLVFSLAFCTLDAARCEEDAATGETEDPKVIFSEVTEAGLFFLNGEYVAAPYTIEATEETVSVNGTAVSIKSRSFYGGFHSGRGGGFRGRGWHRGFRNHRPGGDSRDEPEARESGGGVETHPQAGPGEGFANRFNARRLADSLAGGQIVLLFEQTGQLIVVPSNRERELAELLLSDVSQREPDSELTGMPMSRDNSKLWNDWLLDSIPSEAARIQLQTLYDKRQKVKEKNDRAIAAVHRLENWSYPLTLLGMLVGVVALGHLLRWPRKGEDAGSEAVRAVEIALWLMLGMALIDLTWTVLATQAGVMKEVNPLAEKLVDSPLQLAIFKTFATGVGLAIFFLWRHRRQIQVATWWMCLVCVLVTFRWIIFDSAMSP